MAGSLNVGGTSGGLLSGQKTIGPVTMVGQAVVGEILDVALKAGDTTVTVPTGAIAVLIVPPVNNGTAWKLRTNLNSADGGLSCGLTGFMVYGLPEGTTSLILHAEAGSEPFELSFI